MDIRKFWNAIAEQDAETIRTFFNKKAIIRWHNTNEQFTLEEFIRANCEYPGKWEAEIERIEKTDNLFITAVKVFNKDASFHAVSFIKIEDDKIVSMDEYWGDDGVPPQWRIDMKIGTKIG